MDLTSAESRPRSFGSAENIYTLLGSPVKELFVWLFAKGF
jgi:hypothetical protein